MEKNLKKLWPALATSFVAAASFVNADVNDAQMRNLENRVSALEQKKGASGMINPSGRPQVKDGADLFITADALVWQARENGLGFAISQSGTAANLNDSTVKDLDYKWDFGFRVGFGINTPHDGWDVYANWTWFQDKAHRGTHAPVGGVLFPVDASPDDVLARTALVSHAHWRLHLNMIDLELGREFFVSKWVTLRPFMGLRTGWIHQHLKVNYEALSSTYNEVELDLKNNYWGLGVRPGLSTQWGIGAGFSFYGNTALSLLYGFFDLDHEEETTTTAGVESTYADVDQSFHIGRAIAEIQLGLRYEHMFAKDHCHFSIQVGWENFMFFGQNQFKRFVDDTAPGVFVANQGDLTIQGITGAIRLDF